MSQWVLLRGLLRDRRHWDDLPQRLRQRCPGEPVWTPDLAGNGARFRERSPASLAGMVTDLREALGRLGARPPYRIAALSLGGMIALEWARRYPQEIRSAVLGSTSLRGYSPFWQRFQPAAWPLLLRALGGGLGVAERETLTLALTAAHPARPATGVIADWTLWMHQTPLSRANALRQLAAAARYRAPSSPPPVPLRLLAGAGDRLVSPECSRRLAQAWKLPLGLHPSAGHDLALDAPDWFLDQLLRDPDA